jgi:ABC-type multidrug transport system fused ATPase/permease subunit
MTTTTTRPARGTAREYAALLATYLRPLRARVLLMTALLLASIALELVGPQALRAFIDLARGGANARALTLIAAAFLAATVGGQLVTALAGYVSADVGWAATNALRGDLTLHCLTLDLSFHQARTPGELIERVDSDVAALADFFSSFVVRVLGNGLLVLGILALVTREDVRVGGALALFAALALAVLWSIQRRTVPAFAAQRQAMAELSGFWGEHLDGLEDIAANGAGDYTRRRYFALQRPLNRANIRVQLMVAAVGAPLTLLMLLGTALALGLGAIFYTAGTMTLGAVFLLSSYTALLLANLTTLTEHLTTLQQAAAAFGRIAELLHTSRRVRDGPAPAGTLFPVGPLAVEFRHVSFGYDEGDLTPQPPSQRGKGEPDGPHPKPSPVRGRGASGAPSLAASLPTGSDTSASPSLRRGGGWGERSALHDISFALAPGAVAGLVGHTGSGKTTLTRLLFRFYDPSIGAVLLGGRDVRRAALDDLRRRIGVVTQEVQLFHASLRDNLTLFDESIPDARLYDALERVGLGDWLARLPAGLASELTLGTLSAGEAQLLAFARVLLGDPQLVLLDEASSRLDPATERLVWRATDELLRGRTGLIIAHRLATLERVDRVLVLDGGRLVEDGPRAALTADPASRYAALVRAASAEGVLA